MNLLAHQGGWDEALLVAGPLLAIVGLLWLAKRRADRLPQQPQQQSQEQSQQQSSQQQRPPAGDPPER